MSFTRAKFSRSNDREPTSVKALQPETMQNKTERSIPIPRRFKPLIKQRSLSQPSSSTSVSKNVPRPHSGGDEKTLLVNKQQKGNKFTVSEEHSEDEEFESATMIKAPKSEDATAEAKSVNMTDNLKPCTPDGDQKSGQSPTCKASSSGIPLRIKQPPSPTKSSTPTSRKASPRKPPTTATSLNSRGGSSSKVTEQPPKPMTSMARRGLEIQFQSKKKKMDQLKKEIIERQKPLVETYQSLLQLKKKLEESGKSVHLEELKVENVGSSLEQEPQHVGESDGKVDPEIVKQMRQTVKDVPLSLLEICRSLMNKRLVLVDLLDKIAKEPTNQHELQKNIDALRNETAKIEHVVADTFEKHEKNVMELVRKWQVLLNSSGNTTTYEQVEVLQEMLKQKEQRVTEISAELQQVHKKHEDDNGASQQLICDLTNKIKLIEQELKREKSSSQDHKDRNSLNDQRMKVLKTRIKELETKQKDAETKCAELQKTHRSTQEQLRSSEHRWTKERDELLMKHKNDRQMLEKLTKDRSFFETRVKTLEEMVEDKGKTYKLMEAKIKEELEETRKEAAEDRATRDSMQQKFNNIKDQLVQMEIRNKQAIDIVHTKNTFEANETEGITTEREAELYTELLATRVALKAAEDQIQNYNREKLRFIDSIQSLQGDPEKDHDYIAKTLIKNVEKITELESKLTESEEAVCGQKIEIANLRVDIENLRQRPPIMSVTELEGGAAIDGDLKVMLHEGRIKLEQSLKKSLEYEHKIIRYEHDINRQSKQICEMENLLKVRDGLISMMKAKKDELQMENDSLNKYANEIRDLLIQAKEEARNRTELVQELSCNLDASGRACVRLEKKVKELEGCLTMTNEKRFKLQDTIGAMEKELQTTKAQINKLAPEVPSRTRVKSYKKW